MFLRILGIFHALSFSIPRSNDASVTAEDYADCGCLIVCVMSHGEQGLVFARDRHYETKTLWTRFERVKSLLGKPKLFFIQVSIIDLIFGYRNWMIYTIIVLYQKGIKKFGF